MSYWNNTGKFQKNYDYFWNKLVPKSGSAKTNEGELLRQLNYIYYRNKKDGDSYNDLIESNYISEFSENKYFKKELGDEIVYKIEELLTDDKHDIAINEYLKYLMLKRSTPEKIWNPKSNRLIKLKTPLGMKCIEILECSLKYTC